MIPRSGIGKGTSTLLSLVLAYLLVYGISTDTWFTSSMKIETAQCMSTEEAVRGDFLLLKIYQEDGSVVERFIYVAQSSGYGSLFVIPYEGANGRYVDVDNLHRLGIGLAPRDRHDEQAAVWREQQPIDVDNSPSGLPWTE